MTTKNRGKPNCNRWKYRKQEVDERNKSQNQQACQKKYTSQKSENVSVSKKTSSDVCVYVRERERERGCKN
jgi:hypothetical protein